MVRLENQRLNLRFQEPESSLDKQQSPVAGASHPSIKSNLTLQSKNIDGSRRTPGSPRLSNDHPTLEELREQERQEERLQLSANSVQSPVNYRFNGRVRAYSFTVNLPEGSSNAALDSLEDRLSNITEKEFTYLVENLVSESRESILCYFWKKDEIESAPTLRRLTEEDKQRAKTELDTIAKARERLRKRQEIIELHKVQRTQKPFFLAATRGMSTLSAFESLDSELKEELQIEVSQLEKSDETSSCFDCSVNLNKKLEKLYQQADLQMRELEQQLQTCKVEEVRLAKELEISTLHARFNLKSAEEQRRQIKNKIALKKCRSEIKQLQEKCELYRTRHDVFYNFSRSLSQVGREQIITAILVTDKLIEHLEEDDSERQLKSLHSLNQRLREKKDSPYLDLAGLLGILIEYQKTLEILSNRLSVAQIALGQLASNKAEEVDLLEKLVSTSTQKAITEQINFLNDFMSQQELFKLSVSIYLKMIEEKKYQADILNELRTSLLRQGLVHIHNAEIFHSDPTQKVKEILEQLRKIVNAGTSATTAQERLKKTPLIRIDENHLELNDSKSETEESAAQTLKKLNPAGAQENVPPWIATVRKIKGCKITSQKFRGWCGEFNNKRLLLVRGVMRPAMESGAFNPNGWWGDKVNVLKDHNLPARPANEGTAFLGILKEVPVIGGILGILSFLAYLLRLIHDLIISMKNIWAAAKKDAPSLSSMGIFTEIVKQSFSNKKADTPTSETDLVKNREKSAGAFRMRNDAAWSFTNIMNNFWANGAKIDTGGSVNWLGGLLSGSFSLSVGSIAIILLYTFDLWNEHKNKKELEEAYEPFKKSREEEIAALKEEIKQLTTKEKNPSDVKDDSKEELTEFTQERAGNSNLALLEASLEIKQRAWNDMQIQHLEKRITCKVRCKVANYFLKFTTAYNLFAVLGLLMVGGIGISVFGVAAFVFAALIGVVHLISNRLKKNISSHVKEILEGNEEAELSKYSRWLLEKSGGGEDLERLRELAEKRNGAAENKEITAIHDIEPAQKSTLKVADEKDERDEKDEKDERDERDEKDEKDEKDDEIVSFAFRV